MLTVQESSLNWALNHALRYGDTDMFPQPFEYQAIRHTWDRVRETLSATDVLKWETRPARALLAPKAKYAFRTITQLDPLDFLLFAALMYEISSDLEQRRIPIQEGVVFSHRVCVNTEGQLFDPRVGYRRFLKRCHAKLAEKGGYVATADISDFYPRIYHHRLENALGAATRRTSHVRALGRLLSGWNITETFGIPVGPAPSGLLAEITISDVDELLLAHGVDFIRYNDDYRIFAESEAKAYKHLALLAEFLYRNHGLSLQPQKTKIYEAGFFAQHLLTTPEDREADSLYEQFQLLIEELGLESGYERLSMMTFPRSSKKSLML